MGSPKLASESDSASDARLALVTQFIPAGARILEVDAASLTRHLPFGCMYRSAKREVVTAETAEKYDLIVMLAPLNTQTAAETFLRDLAPAERPLLISYRNDDRLGFHHLVRLIGRNGFRVETSAPVNDHEMLLRLAPARKLGVVSPCSVAVLSGGMTFGERLGRQMIATLLPGEADVHYIDLGDLSTARDTYDLVVLGAGQGLFHPLFDSEVLDILKRGRTTIGIFGTQQRELLPRVAVDHLLDNLDVWFARTRDDVMLYGRGRENVTYLGDWLIEQFPLGHGRDPELLTLNEDSLCDLPLDRSINGIQRHNAVFARALAPFLCALNSADTVAYADDISVPSGEFRSLLIDIFGRSFPDNDFFQVDREAVLRYRARVHRNVGLMRARIEALLRGKNTASAA
jgi:hypothetical protein